MKTISHPIILASAAAAFAICTTLIASVNHAEAGKLGGIAVGDLAATDLATIKVQDSRRWCRCLKWRGRCCIVKRCCYYYRCTTIRDHRC